MTVKLNWTINPIHHRVTIFIGPDSDHLKNCGHLCMDKHEAKKLRDALLTGYYFLLEEGWN